MYLCILLFPLLSFLTTNCLNRFIGIYGSCILSTFSIFASFFLSCIAFYETAINSAICSITLNSWFDCDVLLSYWGFHFDTLSNTMLLVVTGVSSLVHLYSTEYMGADPHQGRFMGYLSLFTFFMLILVTADNFVVMFFGWEGIGLASYLLIGFWINRIQAGKSAIKAMIVNRVGDVGLAMGIAAVFFSFKTLDYPTVFACSEASANLSFSFLSYDFNRLSVICFLLFWGALGKSAQLGLHIWLPDAMEGPTPVSALIHAATLVTAGIFLIIRCSSLFELTKITLSIISIIGALTAFFASSVGFVQNDLKRIIAYSTCSQLGYMMLACGLSHYSVAFFHLANHAIFKALLFLGAGSIIHGLLDEQDLRKMGSLILFFPLSYVMILIGSLALVGFPFLTGFYSKDIILEVAAAKATVTGNFTYLLGCLAAFGTAFYSFRLILLCFINSCNSYKLYIEQAHDGALRMVIPLLILGLGSIFWGFISKDLVIGFGSPIFSTSIQTSTYQLIQIDSEFLPASIKLIPLILTLIGICLSFLLINCSFLSSTRFIYEFKMSKSYRTLYTFLSKKWYFDQLMGDLIVQRVMNFGYNTSFLLLDKGFIEVLGPSGFSNSSISFSRANSIAQNGQVSNYSFIMLFSIITVISVSFCFYYNVFITSTLFSTLLFLSYWVWLF